MKGTTRRKGLYQALAVAAMCLQEEATTRPLISDVVTAIEFLGQNKTNPEDPEGDDQEDDNDEKSTGSDRSDSEDEGNKAKE